MLELAEELLAVALDFWICWHTGTTLGVGGHHLRVVRHHVAR